MSVAYVDTSCLVAVAFAEPGYDEVAHRLGTYSRLLSSNLLEAELRAVFAREGSEFGDGYLSGVDWIIPDRPLSSELDTVIDSGYLAGADLWHLATALYIAREPDQISFITLDKRQRTVAARCGFRV